MGNKIKIDKSKFLEADRLTQIALGNVPGHKLITKFGRNAAIGTAFTPVTTSGKYYTPTAPVSGGLEAVSAHADDNATGTGARKIMVQGLGADWAFQEEEVTLNGITAVPLTKTFTRVFRVFITEIGTYSDVGVQGQAGIIDIRETSTPANIWAKLDIVGNLGTGQSQIGVYSVPKGSTGIILNKNISMDTGKVITIGLFSREGCDVIAAPFTPRKVREMEEGLDVPFHLEGHGGLFTVTGPADVGFMAKVSTGTAIVACDFQIIEIENEYL